MSVVRVTSAVSALWTYKISPQQVISVGVIKKLVVGQLLDYTYDDRVHLG